MYHISIHRTRTYAYILGSGNRGPSRCMHLYWYGRVGVTVCHVSWIRCRPLLILYRIFTIYAVFDCTMPATQRPSRSSASSQSQQPQQQPPTTESSISTGSTSNTIKPTLREQLDQAEVAIRKTRDATAQLHYWWRQHLFRLSCMVFLLCFYQARKPSEACIRNIKVRCCCC